MAKIYVGTYAKYNNGSIEGKWLDLEDYSDKEEFYEACAELHEDEEDPEFMFQDYEECLGMVSESFIDEKIFELLQSDHDIEAIEAYMYCYGEWDEQRFEDAYVGEWKDDEDFAYDQAEQMGDIEKDVRWPYTCIDWASAARDLMWDYTEHNGHYFRNF